MKAPRLVAGWMLSAALALAAPFTPGGRDEPYGVGSWAWRFSSNLTKDASGMIELCYAETGQAERALGRVPVRPFQSSEEKLPDLRILLTKVESDGAARMVLIVGYGLRGGTFLADVPGLTQHSLVMAGKPLANAAGEYTLLGFGDGAVKIRPDGLDGVKGRLFFRYVESR